MTVTTVKRGSISYCESVAYVSHYSIRQDKGFQLMKKTQTCTRNGYNLWTFLQRKMKLLAMVTNVFPFQMYHNIIILEIYEILCLNCIHVSFPSFLGNEEMILKRMIWYERSSKWKKHNTQTLKKSIHFVWQLLSNVLYY